MALDIKHPSEKRVRIGNALHHRIFPLVKDPCRVIQYLFVFESEQEREAEYEALRELGEKYHGSTLENDAQSYELNLANGLFRWERHTEFSTYSFISFDQLDEMFIDVETGCPERDWLQAIPGEIFRVSQVLVIKATSGINTDQYAELFQPLSCVRSLINQHQAEVWTDFLLHPEGGGRTLIIDFCLHEHRVGRLIQQLLDVGNYRRMSLLGWPLAQQALEDLKALEKDHSAAIERVRVDGEDDQQLLAEMTEIAAQTEELIALNSARLRATVAYYQLTLDRLNAVDETPVDGYFTIEAFTDRRLKPAFRTAESVLDRQRQLSDRLGRTFDLLRTRSNLKLEGQNQDLLKSIDKSGRTQVNLQRLVEIVSVVAVSYYLLDMVHYMFVGLQHLVPSVDPELGRATAVPLVLLVVTGLLFMLRKAFEEKG